MTSADTVIRCEGLGKSYQIAHLAERERYASLRDTLAQSARHLVARAMGRGAPPSSAVEEFWALNDVSFEVKRGEVVGIIGRNGAGKSTLLKILSRITEPTRGRVELRGRVASLLEVGTGFHPELTGRENIYLNGAILGMTRAEIRKKFDEIVAFAEVEKFLDTPVKRYSSGMYVRLAFAVAAHLEPEILLVDEVLAVGDAEFQKKCIGKMSTVAEAGRTVLFVSHNTQAVSALCGRAIWLDKQRVALDGKPADVFPEYLREAEAHDVASVIAGLPDDPVFRLLDVELTQGGEPLRGGIEASLPLEIRISYDVKKTVFGLRVLFLLCDTFDNIILKGWHDEAAESVAVMEPGRYVSTAVVPANLIAPVQYRLKIQAGFHHGRPVIPLDGFALSLRGIKPYQGPPEYAGEPCRALLAPRIAWRNEMASFPSRRDFTH